MLAVGIMGVLVMYGGFLYLFFSGRSTAALPWFFLISPWICIYFGLSQKQQIATINWFIQKFSFKKAQK
ncbi:hypothetical protein [Shewanella gaetbuli]|uniref:Uncharacterized protein n=1 Tax=Shewanella gaetbuli TaxID=220752 RepID=A0A9X1ZJB6_9GAMM|nr:hypothetical protein [Shewanella gaetbuli]MCL1143364.1 hypothetical protein [Shewanella gaetbuli]